MTSVDHVADEDRPGQDVPEPRVRLRDARLAIGLALGAAPWTTGGYLAVLLVGSSVPVLVAWATKSLLDGLTSDVPLADLLLLGGCLAALGVLANALPHGQHYLYANLDRATSLCALERLYGTVNGLRGIAPFESPSFLDRLRLAHQSTTGIPASVVQSLVGLISSTVTVVGFLIALVAIRIEMAAVVLVSAIPALVAEFVLSRRRARMMWDLSPVQRRELIYSTLLSDVQAAKEIRLFGIGDFLLGRIRRERVAANDAQRRMDGKELRIQLWLGVLSAAVAGAGLVWAVFAAHAGELGVGDVTLFVASVAGVQAALLAAIGQLAAAHQTLLMFGHYTDVLETPPGLPSRSGAPAAPPLRTGIRFENVWFRYTDDLPWVLQGVDLELPFGRAVALVGVNGAGKSTLVKLLCRLYDPTRGRILWDGVDLRDLDLVELRARMGAVFQDFMQYDLTAAENIAVGDLAALDDRARLERAAARAGADGLLAALPRGYDTLLTRELFGVEDAQDPENGIELSGGQWQRVAVARALLREASDLLILDEPSSGLDAEAEHDIHQTLHGLRKGRTSLLISHRLGAVKDADRIVVLEGGRITEQGTHADLLATAGRYAHLFGLQARGYLDGAEPPAPVVRVG